MRLKYYLRGAGFGVLITTAIFTLVLLFNNYGKISDEEVITRAKAMGYTLSDEKKQIVYTNDTTTVPADSTTDKATETDNKTEATKVEDTKTENTKIEDSNKSDTTAADTKTETKADTDTKSPDTTTEEKKTTESTAVKAETSSSVTYMPFTIDKGEDSEDVCKRLAELGMISDAKTFNRKLVEDGVDSKIVVGTFYINTGMTEAQIEDVLSSSKNRKTSLSN